MTPTTYTATLRTDSEFAVVDIDAASPAEALTKARALLTDPSAELEFEPYDGPGTVDEIEITRPGESSLAVWQSDELRLRFAADTLFAALEAATCPVWVHNAAITDDIEALRRIALWLADWNNTVRIPALDQAKGQAP